MKDKKEIKDKDLKKVQGGRAHKQIKDEKGILIIPVGKQDPAGLNVDIDPKDDKGQGFI